MKDRKAEALAAAKACAELLKTRFGARRVIIFGPLVSQGPFIRRCGPASWGRWRCLKILYRR